MTLVVVLFFLVVILLGEIVSCSAEAADRGMIQVSALQGSRLREIDDPDARFVADAATGIITLTLIPPLAEGSVHTLPATVVYPLTLQNHSTLSDTVDLSVESDSPQVVPMVIPSSTFLAPYGSASISVQVPLPADFSGNRVTTTVYAEARNQIGDASAVQATYYQPYSIYLPLIWKKPPPAWQCTEQGKNIWTLAATQGQPPHIYAGPDQPQLLRSTTCGTSWQGVGPRLDNIVALAVCDSKLYMAAWGSHVYVCETDEELTCHQETIDGGLQYIGALVCDENAHLVYAGTNQGAVFRSAVGSGQWTKVVQGLEPVWAMHVVTDGHAVYAGTLGGGVHRSVDGSSWTPYNNGLPSGDARWVWALETDPGGQLCAGTNDGAYCVDSDRWRSDGLQGKSIYALATDLDRARLYAGTNGYGVFASIGGDTWIPLNTGLQSLQVNTLLVQETCAVILAGTRQGVCAHPLGW
jgi:hypothetical protein